MATPVAGVNNLQPQTPATASTSSSSQDLGANQFLQLLTTELQNQDPLNPVDDTQSVAQLAQFSALQATQELNQSFQNFQSNFGVMQASTLIGKTVTVVTPDASGNASTTTGTVASIDVQNGVPYFTMNGSNGQPLTDGSGNPLLFATNSIVGIGG